MSIPDLASNMAAPIPGSILTGIQFSTVYTDDFGSGLNVQTTALSANASGGFIWGSNPYASPAAQTMAASNLQFINLSPVVLPAGWAGGLGVTELEV